LSLALVGASQRDPLLGLEGAILLFLFSLSGALESYALGKSRTAIHALMELRPNQGLVRHPDGNEELVPVEQLKVGQIVIVKPGEYIPIDGRIVRGYTNIDQSAITGESIPVLKEPGDSVFAATLNEQGAIEVEVTKPSRDTTLAKIIELVEKAQKNKARTQRFLERFEPAYAVSVVIAVILLILIPWLLLDHDFEPVFYRAMTVLVVASPCALIISTPASIISAIANAARNGILFKGGAHIEQTIGIDTIAHHKTGTLKRGRPVVTDILPFSNGASGDDETLMTREELISLAAGCELYSEHHLAEAIINKARETGLEPVEVENLQALPGQGVQAEWGQKRISVGNQKLYEQTISQWPSGIHDEAERLRHVDQRHVDGFDALPHVDRDDLEAGDSYGEDCRALVQSEPHDRHKRVYQRRDRECDEHPSVEETLTECGESHDDPEHDADRDRNRHTENDPVDRPPDMHVCLGLLQVPPETLHDVHRARDHGWWQESCRHEPGEDEGDDRQDPREASLESPRLALQEFRWWRRSPSTCSHPGRIRLRGWPATRPPGH
jgi:hypothetical protein